MNYENTIIDNQAILEFRDGVEREVHSCTEALKRMAQKIQQMQMLDGFEGESAESIKTYFSEVHLFLLEAIGEALTECESMLNQYAMEILCNVDSSPYARIPVSDLLGMQDQVKSRYLDMDETIDSVNKLMSSIQDLVQVNPIQTEVGSTGGPFAMPEEKTMSVSYDRENIVKSAIINGNRIGLLEHCEEVRSILKESVDKIDRINFDYAMDKIPILEDYVKILDGSLAEYSDIARNMENYHRGDYNKWDSTKCLSDQMLLYSLYYTTNQEEILLAKETLQQVSMEMQQVENKAKKDNTISVAKEIGSFGISLIPFLGDGKDLQESISGLDLITGKKLSALNRVLAGACVIVPVISGSMVRTAGKNADIAEKMSLLSEKQLFKKAGKGITMCEDAKKEMEQLIQEIRTMLEEDADIKRLFIRKTGEGPQVEIAGVGKVSLEEAEKLIGKDVRWSRGESGKTTVIYGEEDIANYQYNMIENPGPLAEMPNQPAKNFYGGRYNMEVLQEDRIMYRAGNAQNPYGRWFTSEPPASVANVRIDTAVKTHWIDPKTGAYEASSYIDNVYAIKVPKGTTIYTGPVGPQGGVYAGGYNVMQTYIDVSWTFEVVEKIPLQ